MFRRFMKGRLALGGLAAIGVLALAAGAYGYFTSSGSSNSTASVGNPSTFGVTITPTGSVSLYPTLTTDSSFPNQPYTGVITNNSSGREQVSTVAAQITSVSPSTSGCAVTNFSFYPTGSEWTLSNGGATATADSTNAPGATTPALPNDMVGKTTMTFQDLAVYMVDTGVAQNECQGVTVNISVTAS